MWAGLRLAMFFGLTPNIVAALAPWQDAQPLLTPLWLKAELAKLSSFTTVVEGMLEPLPTWQLSHPSAPMATWPVGGATMAGLIG